MTVPYTPVATWAEETAKKAPARQADVLDMSLGARFGQGMNGPGVASAPQAPQAPRVPRGTATPMSGSTPMMGTSPVTPYNPFRPAAPSAAPRLTQGTAGGADPDGYVIEDGRLTGSNYANDRSRTQGYRPYEEGKPLQPIVDYDYSPERSHNDYADISDDQYRRLIEGGETNVRDNFESYIDDQGQRRWRYAVGAAGNAAEDHYYGGTRHDANGFPIDDQGNRIAIPGQPVPPPRDPSSSDYGRYQSHGVVQQNVQSGGDTAYVPGGNAPPARGARGGGGAGGGTDYVPYTGPGANLRFDELSDVGDVIHNINERENAPHGSPRFGGTNMPPAPPPSSPPPAQTPDRWTSNYNPGSSGGGYGGGSSSYSSYRPPWQGSLDEQIGSGLDNPSRYDNDLLTSMWLSRAAGIDDEFDAAVRAEDAQLRRQGIRDSTFGGEAMIQRAAGRRDAKSRAAQALAEDVAGTMSADRSRAISDALAAQQAGESSRQFGANYDLSRRFGIEDRDFRNRQFDWSKYMDEEQFNAQQEALYQAFQQWLIDRGIM